MWGRYISELSSFNFESYWQLDLSLKYELNDKIEIRLVGQNLLHDHKPEYISEYLSTQPTENVRKGYVGMSFRF